MPRVGEKVQGNQGSCESSRRRIGRMQASQRAQRRGVSQYRMPHGLLVGGLKAASEIFGGDFAAKHQAAGAVPINYVADMKTVC